MLVNLDIMVTYLCLDIVEWLKEEKLNATEKLVDGKLQTELFIFDSFSPLEVLLLDTN